MSRSGNRNSGAVSDDPKINKDDDEQPSTSGFRRSSDSENVRNLRHSHLEGNQHSDKDDANLETSKEVNYDNFSSAIQTATRYDKTSEMHPNTEQTVDPLLKKSSLPRYKDGKDGKQIPSVPNEMSDESDRPREFYIPPTPSTDVSTIFGGGITVGKNFEKFDDIPIQTSGENVPPLISEFADACLNKTVYSNIVKSQYTKPTPIQKSAIPVVSRGRDLIACAQTGSGKTASYLIPIINSLIGTPVTVNKPNVVILAPTRELAIQIYNETLKFSYDCNLEAKVLYGGTSTKYQQNLVKRANILICTVGRLVDFLRRQFLSFECVTTFVLDEADRLLDQGFYKEMLYILKHETILKPERVQILMYSATFPNAVQMLAAKILSNYVFISVGIVGSACSDIKQSFLIATSQYDKRTQLMEMFLESKDTSGTLIFVHTKRTADFLATFLSENNIPSTSIHGDRLQRQRESALNDFKNGIMKTLVGTSVAARGLDIKNIKHVINFDMPFVIDEYVHRIGRTGRLGNHGRATSFYVPKINAGIVNDLVKILLQAGQTVPEFFKDRTRVDFPLITGDLEDTDEYGAQDVRVAKPVVTIITAEKEEMWDSPS